MHLVPYRMTPEHLNDGELCLLENCFNSIRDVADARARTSGGDSSLLNVLAMTGLLGFAPFLALYLLLAKKAWDLRRTGYGLGFLSALCGLFVHCIFVNSLLFPLFMAPFWISAGLLGSTRE